MNEAKRHLSWPRFEDLVRRGVPAVEAVAGTPYIEIFTDAAGVRIGIRVPIGEESAPPSKLAEIAIRKTQVRGLDVLEVSTSSPALYQDFYSFACAIADRVQVDGLTATDAVEAAVAGWEALLNRLSILDESRQIGLLGELWLLERIAGASSWRAAVGAWKGAHAEEHDFSTPLADIEVKATIGERRQHMVGSLTQLARTADRPLYLLSLQYTRAGDASGDSLGSAVTRVLAAVATDGAHVRSELESRLYAAGWRPDDAIHYHSPFLLRTPPTLVPVDDNCPAITPETLRGLGAGRLARISQVAYRIDVTGLGADETTEAFRAILPEGAA